MILYSKSFPFRYPGRNFEIDIRWNDEHRRNGIRRVKIIFLLCARRRDDPRNNDVRYSASWTGSTPEVQGHGNNVSDIDTLAHLIAPGLV